MQMQDTYPLATREAAVMTGTQGADTALVPIDEVARRLGLRASAIRYYEERGLIRAAARHAGRRWYGPDQLRRLAIIRYWQTSALMSLDEIGDILAGPTATRSWSRIIDDRIETLQNQIERMAAAREFLHHIRVHHRASAPDGCLHYETLIWDEAERTPANRSPMSPGSVFRPNEFVEPGDRLAPGDRDRGRL
jgi:MerR family transcriptional regulator, copper efflux regulator